MIISDITSYDDRLTVRWSDGGETNFDWFWLRDHGEDEGSLDPDTLQRRVDTFALDTGIRPEACSVADNGRTLQISWPGKGEPGLHSAAALASQAGLAPDNADLAPETNQCLWSAEAPLSLPDPVAFGDFMETGAGHRTVLERIHVNGFAVIEGVPTDETSGRRLYERIGYIRESIFGGGWTLSSEVKEHKDTAYSTAYLEPHTDGTYSYDAPGLQSFLCFEFDGTGGESILVDGFAVAEIMRREEPDHYRTLTQVNVPGRYIEPGVHLRAERPPLRLGPDGGLAQVSINNYDRAPFMLPAG